MEVQEQMNSIVHRDPDEVGCRYEKELVGEFPLFGHPRQGRDVGACRRHQRGFPDRYPRLTAARLGWHPRLYLQAAITMSGRAAGQHLDHLQVRKRSENIELWIFCKPADHLRLAQESEPASISIDRLQS